MQYSTLHLPNHSLPTHILRSFASSLTPDFEETAADTISLDLFSLPYAQVAPEEWIDSTLRKATALGHPLHLSLASTPDLAHLAALSPHSSSTLSYSPDPVFRIHSSSEPTLHSLRPLPLPTHPAFPVPHIDLLHLWGVHTLGELAALPRQGLAERLGPEIARFHDILHGKHHRLLTLHRPPQHYRTTQELENPLETLEPLLFLLKRSLDTLCARLTASQRAAQTLHLSLTFDDGNLHLRELHIPAPSRDPRILLRLLHTHLDTLSAPAPIVAFSLKLIPTLPAESQHQLFEHSLRDPNKFADTLARLGALLGPQHLGTPQLLDSHQPDQFELRNPLSPSLTPQPTNSAPSLTPQPMQSTSLPLRRYRPPISIHVASEPRGPHHHPLALLDGPHPGRIIGTRGPFPLSGHWWNPTDRWQHVEWDLQLPNKPLLRLAHLPPHQWQLEGIY